MDGCSVQTEKVISHVLEIIYLMTGEEYMIVKKPPLYKCFPQVSEDLSQARNSVLEIPADSPIHVRKKSGCYPASWVTHGIPQEAQKEFLDSAFQPPAGDAHVQIKCDDVAMYLSVEEWEYLEHHKEEYKVMVGKNPLSPADGPNGKCLQEEYHSQLHSEQKDRNSNGPIIEASILHWNTENGFTVPQVSIGACEDESSPKRERSDKIYGQKNMTTETWDSTQSRDVSALQNKINVNHELLSGILLETEIKEEQANFDYEIEDRDNIAVVFNNLAQVASPSLESIQNFFPKIPQQTSNHIAWRKEECLLDDQRTVNVTDSSRGSKYTLDFVPRPCSEESQHMLTLDAHPTKIAEFIDSDLLGSNTLHHVQSPFGGVLQSKHSKKGLNDKICPTVAQEAKTIEGNDFMLGNDHTSNVANIFKGIPQKMYTKTELKNQDCSTDGPQTKAAEIKDYPFDNPDTESISNILQNVFEKAHIKRKLTYQACSLDEMKEVQINDSLVEESDALYQLSNSFLDGPQKTCIKSEPIHQYCSANSHQKMSVDKNDLALVGSDITGCVTSQIESHCKKKLTYRECARRTQKSNIAEVQNSTPNNNSSLSIDWQTISGPSVPLDCHYFIKESVQNSKNNTCQSTGRSQPSAKPLKISCSDCGKMFSCNSYLSRHQRLHTGEKPFTCSECGKSFSWMSSLVTHKRTHFGEKPFSCKHCGKRFSDYSGVIKHRRSHTGEKPYSCLLCGERFAQTYQLVKHQAVHLVEGVTENSLKGQ